MGGSLWTDTSASSSIPVALQREIRRVREHRPQPAASATAVVDEGAGIASSTPITTDFDNGTKE